MVFVDLVNLGFDVVYCIYCLKRDCLKYFQYRDGCKGKIYTMFDDLIKNASRATLAQYSLFVSGIYCFY